MAKHWGKFCKRILLSAVLSFAPWLMADKTDQPVSVLLLLSYEPLFPIASTIVDEISTAFATQSNIRHQLHVEYMDADLGASTTYLTDYANMLLAKQKNGERYDIVIAAGNSALQLAATEQQRILNNIPIIFLNSTPNLVNNMRQIADITGSVDVLPVYEFISFSRFVYPGYKTLHVITDGLVNRQDRLDQVLDAAIPFGIDINIHSLAEMGWNTLATRLNRIKNEPIVLLSAYRDRYNQEKRLKYAAEFFNQEVKNPIWHLWNNGVGEGLTGAVSLDLHAAASDAVNIALQIINGKSVHDFPINWNPKKSIIIDSEAAAHHGFTSSRFPEKTVFINQKHTFWESYGLYIVGIITVALAFGFLFLLILVEVRRRQIMSTKLDDKTDLMRSILDAIPDVLFHKDLKGRYTFVNSQFEKILNKNPIGLTDYDIFNTDFAEIYEKSDQKTILYKKTVTYEDWFNTGKKTILMETQKTPIFNKRGDVIGIFGLSRDITDLKNAQQNLEHIAHHDPLTGLPNRLMLNKKLDYALSVAKRKSEKLAVIYFDLDRFKDINDTIGHDVGDLLLKDASHRLHNNLRDSDICSRLGGDEFIVVLSNINTDESVFDKTEQLLDVISRPYSLEGHLLSVFASAGVSIYPDDGQSFDELLKNADTALHKAKEMGRNRFHRYEPELTHHIHSRMSLEQDLRFAMEKRQFTLAYQPQFELGTSKPKRVEALLRWPHPTRGFISPTEFIPLAETSGMIIDLGLWVIRTACQQFLEWKFQGLELERIAVNVSSIQFNTKFAANVISILDQLEFNPEWLELEVTESLMMSSTTDVSEQINLLRSLGVEFSIDDFGTGYSSLSKLKSMPVSVLKIDQSFVRDLSEDTNSYEIVQAIIQMAHSLKLTVIAEGVEFKEQETILRRLGCQWVQGYYYSKPISAHDLFKRYAKTKSMPSMAEE